ncbi:hypothetical protein [Geoalkalibacter subterraneus]|uniref:hypothetical protein n=1 Tax=Geoalkalibacter subterraneus TaxID=483547 RepID=UPI00130E537F|nr:hypothetical protein [Geoalkalibacter subterraneus]
MPLFMIMFTPLMFEAVSLEGGFLIADHCHKEDGRIYRKDVALSPGGCFSVAGCPLFGVSIMVGYLDFVGICAVLHLVSWGFVFIYESNR